ncbi:hypothetical protein OIB37_09725 [Streptomyces sp. NBC_00820]|uniref:vWA-MoxR associated conflict system protein n=1 Tax=Streptomyces sp. NBC_00820 TaxID=2975842 RepID=UPI002ED2E2DE|nr:hypothetical protein OIB37_09725 [Streptomyces sp. NBC_00820]
MTPASLPPPRHLLVIGAQCAAMGYLDRLTESATLLHGVLSEPSLGGCVPGLPDGRSLLLGEGLTAESVVGDVRAAYRFAGERGAVLVLALLGHGFVPGTTSSLYYMAGDSRPEERDHAVEVGPLLRDAADRDGVHGVVCVVDTCHAGGAMPDSRELAAGVRGGSARLAVLTSCGAAQPAIDLRLSRELADLLQRGDAEGGRFIDIGTAARALRSRVLGQNVGFQDWDGHPFAREPLWLVPNTRHPEHSTPRSGALGPRAREELAAALAALEPPIAHGRLPASVDDATDLLGILTARPADPMTQRAVRAVKGVVIAFRTMALLSDWLGGEVTTAHLRRALGAVLTAEAQRPTAVPRPTLAEAVDHFVHEFPVTDPDCLRRLTRFVVLLGTEAGQDPADPVVKRWARSVDASVALNDALDFARELRDDRLLSLVVSLHASLTGDWPDSVDAWLLQDGAVVGHEQYGTPDADQARVEEVLDEAVLWAEEEARERGLRLHRIDVALPAARLLDWHPEETGLGVWLGHQFAVVLHWSGRLAPTRPLRRLHNVVKDRWERMLGCTTGVPVDWLDRHTVRDPELLRGELRKGRYARGIGLLYHPAGDEALMETLLSYTPVFFWPRRDSHHAAGRDCLDQYWPTMPMGLTHAYRRRWLGDDGEPVADLRAVWDSGEWLAFCQSISQRVPPAETCPGKEET